MMILLIALKGIRLLVKIQLYFRYQHNSQYEKHDTEQMALKTAEKLLKVSNRNSYSFMCFPFVLNG